MSPVFSTFSCIEDNHVAINVSMESQCLSVKFPTLLEASTNGRGKMAGVPFAAENSDSSVDFIPF